MVHKLSKINGGYILLILKKVCELYHFKPNNKSSIEPICNVELRLRKIPIILKYTVCTLER